MPAHLRAPQSLDSVTPFQRRQSAKFNDVTVSEVWTEWAQDYMPGVRMVEEDFELHVDGESFTVAGVDFSKP